MKFLRFILVAFVLAVVITACEQSAMDISNDEMVTLRNGDEPQMVPFKGMFDVVPVSNELIECVDESGLTVMLPAFNTILGNATHLGLIDAALSSFNIAACDLDLAGGALTLTDTIVIRNKKGDGFMFTGESVVDPATNLGIGYYEVLQGYGKFENAEGWMYTYGDLNNEPPTFTADGEVTQPNH